MLSKALKSFPYHWYSTNNHFVFLFCSNVLFGNKWWIFKKHIYVSPERHYIWTVPTATDGFVSINVLNNVQDYVSHYDTFMFHHRNHHYNEKELKINPGVAFSTRFFSFSLSLLSTYLRISTTFIVKIGCNTAPPSSMHSDTILYIVVVVKQSVPQWESHVPKILLSVKLYRSLLNTYVFHREDSQSSRMV